MFNSSRTTRTEVVLPLFPEIPTETIAIQLESDSTFRCYFDRKEWSSYVDSVTVDAKLKTDYFNVLDKINKRDGVINTDVVPICPNDPTCLNAHRVTLDIIDKLFHKGHLYIKYPNGIFVASLLYITETNKTVRKEYYKDKSNGKTLRYRERNMRGGF